VLWDNFKQSELGRRIKARSRDLLVLIIIRFGAIKLEAIPKGEKDRGKTEEDQ
jgi:hypothetical protein